MLDIDSTVIKQKALEYGADIVGIADSDRYQGTSPIHDPRMIMPRACSVIGAAFRVPLGVVRTMREGTQYYAYTSLGVKTIEEEVITTYLLKMARVIENAGYEASLQRPAPNLIARDDSGTNPEVLSTFQMNETRPVAEGKPAPDVMLDFQRSAVLCGLGSLGYRGNVITPRFGPFQRLCYIITDAPLQPDPIFPESLCDGCGECARACPGHAIGETKDREPPEYDRWQCSVYYRGAHRSNPHITDNFLQDHPDRETVLNGLKRFDREEALSIHNELHFLPAPQYEYASCLCGKRCDVACYDHLHEKGLLLRPGGRSVNGLKERIREFARACGADLVGFSGPDRFTGAHSGPQPLDIFPQTQTIIGLGFRVLRGTYRGIEEGSTFYQYPSMGVECLEETYMPQVLLKVTGFIEDAGFEAVPQRRHARLVSDTDDIDPEVMLESICRNASMEKQMDFSIAAVACGLGEIGMSGAVLTDDFGPFQRFCFILTEAPLDPDPLMEPHLCDRCGACARACYGNALDGGKETLQVAGCEYTRLKRDNWQCAVYYQGANRSRNPFMPPDALAGLPDRESVLQGEKRLSRDEAVQVLEKLKFYGGVRYGYAPSICGRACDRACYVHLEKQKSLKRTFREVFRDRPEWRLR